MEYQVGEVSKLSNNSFVLREDHRFKRHEILVAKYLPQKDERGYFALHSLTIPPITVSIERLKETFLDTGRTYSESLTNAVLADTHPDGYSRRYEVKSPSGDRTTSQMTTCYFDGHIVTDGYLDMFCEDDDGFNPNWFTYKIQRHLQLTKEVFDGLTDEITCAVIFENIEKFKWEVYRSGHIWQQKPYAGYHGDIVFEIKLEDIYGRERWNIKMDAVEDTMKRIARIFGLDSLPQAYWSENGELDYSRGMGGR